ncbi:MAG: hypothetical protein JWO37_3611 [Acidimicrobiales bacterium]|nr:hypothetical protein [Acidimicrobiales bacterium]
MARRLLAALALVALVVAGCGSSGSSARPSTTAQVRFARPTPNEVTGPNITIELVLIGATVVPQTGGKLSGDKGHIHVTVDNKLVSMAYGTRQDLNGLTVGPHTIQAEFVAVDHRPFANRVLSPPVIFTVK